MKFVVLILSVCFVGLAYHLHCPLPEGLAEPGRLRVRIAFARLGVLTAKAVELVTGRDRTSTLHDLIELFLRQSIQDDEEVKTEERTIDGVPVLMYIPQVKTKSHLPCIIYYHGGGWALLTVYSYNAVTRDIAAATKSIVISVDYRRAPSHIFPVQFDDSLKVARSVLENGAKDGIDTSRVAVAGDSCGGNLAAAVALRLSEENLSSRPQLKLQVLIQPILQPVNFDTPSYRQNAHNTFLPASWAAEYWLRYMGIPLTWQNVENVLSNSHMSPALRRWYNVQFMREDLLPSDIQENYVASSVDPFSTDFDKELAIKVDAKAIDPYLAPLVSEDVSKVPTAYILVSEYDVLRDDGLFYAQRLRDANVTTEVNYVKDQTHGFMGPYLKGMFIVHKPEAAHIHWEHIFKFIEHNL